MRNPVPSLLNFFPKFKLFLALFLFCLNSGGNEAKLPGIIYTAFYPPSLTPFSDFDVHIFVQTSDLSEEVKFNASLRCEIEDFNRSIALWPGSTRKLTIPVGNVTSAECSFDLQIEGEKFDEKSQGDEESETTIPSENTIDESYKDYDEETDANNANPDAPPPTISVSLDDFIFIQTDKTIYKPGDKFQFRTLLLNAQSRPKRGTLDVRIFDGDKNLIKLWKGVHTDSNGLFRGNLLLSYDPILGDWRIEALVNRGSRETVKKSVSFKVGEYVLPKFELDVEVPAAMLISDATIIPMNISAKYLYGKSIQGVANVKVKLTTTICGKTKTTNPNLEYNFNITDGALKERIDLSNIISNKTSDGATIEFHVTVREKHTENTAGDVKSLVLHAHKYKIKPIEKLSYHRPRFTFLIDFAILDIHRNVADINDTASIKHNFYDDPKFEKFPVVNGLIHINFTSKTFHSHFIEVAFEDAKLQYILPERIGSNVIHALAIYIDQNASLTNEFLVRVEVSRPVKSVNYLIITDAKISSAGVQELPMPLPYFDIRLNVRSMIGRNSKLFVFTYIDDEFVGDLGFLKITNSEVDSGNFNITLTKNVASPGEKLELIIRGLPNSAISLRGVDESLYLLNTNEDFNQEELENAFSSLDNELNRGYKFPELAKSGLHVVTNLEISKKYGSISQSQEIDLHGEICFEGTSASWKPDVRKSIGAKPIIRLRSFFPETWLWTDATTDDDGKCILNVTAPDTLTSWGITGFSVNPKTGVDFASKKILTTFTKFFITLDLPYSVVQGETLNLIILIHNYLPDAQWVTIALANEYKQFVEDLQGHFKHLNCNSNQVTSATMKLTPKSFGNLKLTIITASADASDVLTRTLLVVPQGVKHVVTESAFIGTSWSSIRNRMSINLPPGRTKGAGSTKLTFIADVLNSASENLAHLIELPVGCGEQNMMNFAVDVVVLNYLNRTHRLRPAIRDEAMHFLEIGYQRQLKFRHDDGSFSAFGKSDESGSTWLTAYVLRYFVKAKEFVTIDDAVISAGLNYLIAQQSEDGAFAEKGKVVDESIFGNGDMKDKSLTAFCALTLLEAQRAGFNVSARVFSSAQNFFRIKRKWLSDLYALSLVTYVDHVAGELSDKYSNNTYYSREMLSSKRCTLTTNDNKLSFWTTSPCPWVRSTFTPETQPINIKITAYALMSLLLRGDFHTSAEVALWLRKNQNPSGGFISSHDTVVALEALALFAETLVPTTIQKQIQISWWDGVKWMRKDRQTVTNENANVLTEINLDPNTEKVVLISRGTGTVYAKVTWTYYMKLEDARYFRLNVTQNSKNIPKSVFAFQISCRTTGFQSNMAIMEVSLPSGYGVHYYRTIRALKENPRYRMHELRNEGTQLVVYFDYLDSADTVVRVWAKQTFLVEELQMAVVRVFDYYEPSKQAVFQYSA